MWGWMGRQCICLSSWTGNKHERVLEDAARVWVWRIVTTLWSDFQATHRMHQTFLLSLLMVTSIDFWIASATILLFRLSFSVQINCIHDGGERYLIRCKILCCIKNMKAITVINATAHQTRRHHWSAMNHFVRTAAVLVDSMWLGRNQQLMAHLLVSHPGWMQLVESICKKSWS